MRFLRVNVMFYDAASVTRDIIRTANPFPYTVGVRYIIKLNKSDVER